MRYGFGVLAVLVVLVGCGGGGGNQALPHTSAGQPAPTPGIVNQSGGPYLPLATGNSWTFTDGTQFVDLGTVPDASDFCLGGSRVAVYPQGNPQPAFSFILDATHLYQVTRGDGTNMADALACYADPRIAGILLPFSMSAVGDQTGCPSSPPGCLANMFYGNIIAVGQTVTLPDGRKIINVDTEGVAQLQSAPAFSWSFAPGVGFVSYNDGTLNLTLKSYSVK